MFIGDEYAVIRAATGTLPTALAGELLLAVPGAMVRLRRSHERAESGAAAGSGQIITRLRALPQDALDAVMEPDPRLIRIISRAELDTEIAAVSAEATVKGIPITPLAAEYAAAAWRFGATIWVGYDQNIPRWEIEGPGLAGVGWRRLSDLADVPGMRLSLLPNEGVD